LNAVGGEFVGDRDALLGIGHVIAVGDGDLLAENAAGGLMSATARSTRVLQSRARWRRSPGNWAATASLICACAAPESAMGETKARLSVLDLFHPICPLMWFRKFQSAECYVRALAAPAQSAMARTFDPAILGHHPAHAVLEPYGIQAIQDRGVDRDNKQRRPGMPAERL